jgi:glucosamine kinase
MKMSCDIRVVAIDGGGTRCRIAVQRGDAVSSIETGSANVSTDFEGAVQEVLAGLLALCDREGLDFYEVTTWATFVGLAGVTGPEVAEKLAAALPFENARFEDDRRAALRGALSGKDGVIAHCGTGSFFGARRNGSVKFSGGWGRILGDEASAVWIGRKALSQVLETVDGRQASSGMSEALLVQFDGAAGIVRFAEGAKATEFGVLAPTVTSHAADGDPLAKHVMMLGAVEIERSLRQMGWTPGEPICLTGGIGPQFAPFLPQLMQKDLSKACSTPLEGALALARELVRL